MFKKLKRLCFVFTWLIFVQNYSLCDLVLLLHKQGTASLPFLQLIVQKLCKGPQEMIPAIGLMCERSRDSS